MNTLRFLQRLGATNLPDSVIFDLEGKEGRSCPADRAFGAESAAITIYEVPGMQTPAAETRRIDLLRRGRQNVEEAQNVRGQESDRSEKLHRAIGRMIDELVEERVKDAVSHLPYSR